MSITSFSFLVFFLVSLAAYYIMPMKCRWFVLLEFSLLFYLLSAAPYTILYLLISVVSVYFAGNYFEKIRSNGETKDGQMPTKAKRILILVLLVNVGMLAALKYVNFFILNINSLAGFLGWSGEIENRYWIASLGISYYTLQMIGYVCDSYGGGIAPQKNFLKLLLFGCYYPQMTSGPISRYDQIADQLYMGNSFHYETVVFGMQRILWGFFKKLVVADRLGKFVGAVYEHPHNYSAFYIWIATFAFVIELYADFSGGMDIILGVSECFGIRLPENFRSPFLAKSIQEFWQRWHITLGTWLKDYIMYPMQKSDFMIALDEKCRAKWGKKGKRVAFNLCMLCLWLAMGMWHGSSWKYIVGEGVWFWLVIVLGRACEPFLKRMIVFLHIKTDCFSYRLFQSLRTFCIFSVGMVFFRAVTLKESFRLLFLSVSMEKITAMQKIVGIGLDGRNWFICLLGMLAMLIVDLLHEKMPVRETLAKQNLVFRWFFYLLLIFSVLLWGCYGPGYNAADFIYQGF